MQSLRYLKFYRIVHLDLKPNNIMISRTMMVKIIDFGESYHPNICPQGNLYIIQYMLLALLCLTAPPKAFTLLSPSLRRTISSLLALFHTRYCMENFLSSSIMRRLTARSTSTRNILTTGSTIRKSWRIMVIISCFPSCNLSLEGVLIPILLEGQSWTGSASS